MRELNSFSPSVLFCLKVFYAKKTGFYTALINFANQHTRLSSCAIVRNKKIYDTPSAHITIKSEKKQGCPELNNFPAAHPAAGSSLIHANCSAAGRPQRGNPAFLSILKKATCVWEIIISSPRQVKKLGRESRRDSLRWFCCLFATGGQQHHIRQRTQR